MALLPPPLYVLVIRLLPFPINAIEMGECPPFKNQQKILLLVSSKFLFTSFHISILKRKSYCLE
jgi:hypothetical protein